MAPGRQWTAVDDLARTDRPSEPMTDIQTDRLTQEDERRTHSLSPRGGEFVGEYVIHTLEHPHIRTYMIQDRTDIHEVHCLHCKVCVPALVLPVPARSCMKAAPKNDQTLAGLMVRLSGCGTQTVLGWCMLRPAKMRLEGGGVRRWMMLVGRTGWI